MVLCCINKYYEMQNLVCIVQVNCIFQDDNEFFILLRDTVHTYVVKTIFSLCDWMTGFKYRILPSEEYKKFFFSEDFYSV